MRLSVKFDSTEKILLRRSLGSDKKAQKWFTHEFRRLSDKYVPKREGVLKDTAIEKTTQIEYVQPYARRQYYENKGKGQRGSHWDKRMWADNKEALLDSLAKKVGGHL